MHESTNVINMIDAVSAQSPFTGTIQDLNGANDIAEVVLYWSSMSQSTRKDEEEYNYDNIYSLKFKQ